MTRVPIRKGWCPGLYAPMQTHDGWLVRVTPDFEGLTAGQLRFLIDYAMRHGNGSMTLTLRGNLQLRGLDEASARAFASRAVMHRLGLADPAQEARRRILFTSPLAGLDPDCAPDTLALARDIQCALQSLPAYWRAPEKFSLAIDGGGLVPVGALRADLALRCENGEWRLYEGAHCHAPCREDLIQSVMAALLRLTEAVGMGRALHRAAPFTGHVPPLLGAFLPGCFGARAVLGTLDARRCEILADSGATLRLTPWRGLVLDRVIATPDLITEPDDYRLNVVACPGQARCAQGLAFTQRDALSLGPDLGGRKLHVSGCAKSCASHDMHDVTLVASERGYDLIWQGKASDTPIETGLGVEDVRRRLRQT